MALPSGYVRKSWDREYVAQALEMSGKAIMKHRAYGGSQFSILRRGSVTNLFLVGGDFQTEDTVLLGSSDVGNKWGDDDIMVDISHSHSEERYEWLQHAASLAGGSVYLVSLMLSNAEARIWWDALSRASAASPNSIFIMFNFTHRPSSADHLMLTFRQNPRIKNLAVFFSNLQFSGSLAGEAIPLNILHLQGVSVTCEFLAALSNRRAFDVSHTLSLVNIRSVGADRFSTMIDSLEPHKFLKWQQLKQLNLVGFYNGIRLLEFMGSLKECTDSSLYSISLNGSVELPRTAHPTFVGAVIDALHHSGLAVLDLGGFEQDPAIQAQLLQNQQSAIHLGVLEYSKVPAVAVRLFICGDAYAGKTTLLSTLSSVCSPVCSRPGVFDKVKACLMCQVFPKSKVERTRGIEVHTILKDNIRLSAWDMAGQTEFHAFHDHMFPDHGSPAMFMFVWSPMESRTEGRGKKKERIEFEDNFSYWLKFITSKTRQSNNLRKLFVVITRKDQKKLGQDYVPRSINKIATPFSEIIEVVKVLEVDARSKASVEPLASSLFQTARSVLDGVKVFSICSEVSEYLSNRHNRKTLVGEQPIISWGDFSNLCRKEFNVIDPDVQKAISYSLNESGDIIHLSNLPFLVLDPNWFCNEVMGSLIHFSEQDTNQDHISIHDQDDLEQLLKEKSHSTVKGSELLALMEAMHLCCKVPGDVDGKYFIPATLLDLESERLEWKKQSNAGPRFSYVGRRLECDKKDLTFLTPGLFPTIQVTFNKAFFESKANVEWGKHFIFVCMQDIQIIVEWGLAKGEHFIDVMVRAPDDEDAGHTLPYIVNKITKTVIKVCAQPVGNQGVKLVEGIIRPDCLHMPAPPDVRADQCALILDLQQDLKKQLETKEQRQYEKLLYLWDGKNHDTNRFIDLLGTNEFMQILKSYKASLEEAVSITAASLRQENLDFQSASTSGQASQEVRGKGLMQEDINVASTSVHIAGKEVVGNSTATPGKKCSYELITEESTHINIGENEQIVDALSKSMVKGIRDANDAKILRKVESMNAKLVDLKSSMDYMHGDICTKLDAMHADIRTTLDALYKSIVDIRSHVVPKIQRLVEQSLNFAVENEAGKIPRLVTLNTVDAPGVQGRMVTALFKGLKHVRIEMACEHRDAPHPVLSGQEGLIVSTAVEGAFIRKALPYINGFLKVLTLVTKVGAHAVAGAGSLVPDLSKLVALVVDSPGFLESQVLNENIPISPHEDFNGCGQWLVSVLSKPQHGGMNEDNIYSKFKLRRVLYTDTSNVAWLCDVHYKRSKHHRPFPLV